MSNLEPIQRAILREHLKTCGIDFARYFFRHRANEQFLLNWHHYEIEKALFRVLTGEITRLIVNMPPRYTKTELGVINFVANGLAINPRAKFIITSYSDRLITRNSELIRSTVELPEYQELYPMKISTSERAKNLWYTDKGGGTLASSFDGQMTGFGAGLMSDESFEFYNRDHMEWDVGNFTGAIIVDDPVKPKDVMAGGKRLTESNSRFIDTIESRIATEKIPIVLFMQRLGANDASGFLLRGGMGCNWHHLRIPALIDDDFIDEGYPDDYSHGIEIPVDYEAHRGPLWERKHSQETLEQQQENSPHIFGYQYQQKESANTGDVFDVTRFQYYDYLPDSICAYYIYADTAQKDGQHNDFSAFQLWGWSQEINGIYLVDQLRGKFAVNLESEFVAFWDKHKPTLRYPLAPSALKVEDKSSGTTLIQTLTYNYDIPVIPIPRHLNKAVRAIGTAPRVRQGQVYIPNPAGYEYRGEKIIPDWVKGFINEVRKFKLDDSHAFDDQIDPMMDAIEDLLIHDGLLYTDVAMR